MNAQRAANMHAAVVGVCSLVSVFFCGVVWGQKKPPGVSRGQDRH